MFAVREPRTNMLKPQDIVVIIKILTLEAEFQSQRELSVSLKISLSEINAAIKRSIVCGLLISDHGNKMVVNVTALQEFLLHGIKYVFPAIKGRIARGVQTCLIIENGKIPFYEEKDSYVWPDSHGKVRGASIAPLYKSVPKVVADVKNQKLYSILCIIDILRVGSARERDIAKQNLNQILLPNG